MDVLKWISARLLVSEFIAWVKVEKKESFNHNLFKRTKKTAPENWTDRQQLVVEFAQEFTEIQLSEKQLAAEPAA